MYAIEFETVPENGKIALPMEYRAIKEEMKVIIMTKNYVETKTENKKSVFSAVRINTKGYKFNRDEANER